MASVLAECLQDGTLSNYVGTAIDEDADAVLHRFTVMAQAWSKEQQLELNIKPLTAKRLGISSKAYPELDTRIKASRTRVLFEFVTKAVLEIVAWPISASFFHSVRDMSIFFSFIYKGHMTHVSIAWHLRNTHFQRCRQKIRFTTRSVAV